MKLRLAEPGHIVDVNLLPNQAFVGEAQGWLRIGALTGEADVERSEVVRSRYPLLRVTAG